MKLLLLLALLCSGCGDEAPTSPTPVPPASGGIPPNCIIVVDRGRAVLECVGRSVGEQG